MIGTYSPSFGASGNPTVADATTITTNCTVDQYNAAWDISNKLTDYGVTNASAIANTYQWQTWLSNQAIMGGVLSDWQRLQDLNSALPNWRDCLTIMITTNNTPVLTPIRYRWQDYGLPGPQ